MTNIIRRLGTPLAVAAALALGACSGADKSKDAALASDTALKTDLQLASKDTAVQPQLKDVAPAASAPAPTTPKKTTPPRTAPPKATTPPPAPAPTTTASGNTVTRTPSGSAPSNAGGAVGVIPSGTALALKSGARVCTNTYTVGQTFDASVATAVSGSNGASIPAGASVKLEVTQLKRSENVKDNIVMEFAVRSVSFGGRTYPVSATVASADVDKVRNEPQAKDAQKVVGGAVIGAIAGRILGKSTKATVVGAAAGAAAGAGVAAGTANYEGCLPDGGNIAVTLSGPLQVKIS
ncbi:MAG: hypothetical protein ABJE47_07800 [bacterium]